MPAYKYTLKSGKQLWYANFYAVDWKGDRQHICKRGFATKKEALEFERSYLDHGRKDPALMFQTLVEEYLADMQGRLKPTTFETKKSLIDTKILPYFKKLKISDIDPRAIRSWQNALMDMKDDDGNAKYAQTYLKSIHSQLSAIMNYAVKYYHLPSNPCLAAGSIGKSKAAEMTIWSKEQFEQFISLEKKNAYRTAFLILFWTGCREGELLALTPADIPEDQPIIDINKTYAVVQQEELFLTPKTEASIRKIAIHETLHQEILKYIHGMLIRPDERIFYFRKYGLLQELHRIAKKAGLPKIRIHDLRHSHVSMLIDMGIPITEISRRLGHESPDITLRIYSHLYPGKERRVADSIEEVYTGENRNPNGSA